MKKIAVGLDIAGCRGELSYEWEKHSTESADASKCPVLKIIGTGSGWAKETNGPVKINPVPNRPTVLVTGPGGWKITGPENIG